MGLVFKRVFCENSGSQSSEYIDVERRGTSVILRDDVGVVAGTATDPVAWAKYSVDAIADALQPSASMRPKGKWRRISDAIGASASNGGITTTATTTSFTAAGLVMDHETALNVAHAALELMQDSSEDARDALSGWIKPVA